MDNLSIVTCTICSPFAHTLSLPPPHEWHRNKIASDFPSFSALFLILDISQCTKLLVFCLLLAALHELLLLAMRRYRYIILRTYIHIHKTRIKYIFLHGFLWPSPPSPPPSLPLCVCVFCELVICNSRNSNIFCISFYFRSCSFRWCWIFHRPATADIVLFSPQSFSIVL